MNSWQQEMSLVTTRIALIILFLTASAFGQSTANTSAVQTKQYPAVIRADIPFYPPIARLAHIAGTVEIAITIEKGAVVDAQVKSVVLDSPHQAFTEEGRRKVGLYLSNPSLANVKTWQFESEDRTTFVVAYVYKIEGEQTEQTSEPENPKVEFDLPQRVTVTARPVKPTCSDCR